jgi:acetolactate synthase-1/2/3 large subunit
VTSLTAKGVVSEDHAHSVGVVGRSGTFAAAQATRAADVVVAIGARFSDNHTSNWRDGKIYEVLRTKIIQADLDVTEISRNYPVEVGLLSDARTFIEDLSAALDGGRRPDRNAWLAEVRGYKAAWREEIAPLIHAETDPIHPARLVHELGEALGTTGRVFIDVGDVIQYAEAYMTIRGHGQWHINPGMAEMSWPRPASSVRWPPMVPTGDRAHRGWGVQHGVELPRDCRRVRPAGDLGDPQQSRARHRAKGRLRLVPADPPVGAIRTA